MSGPAKQGGSRWGSFLQQAVAGIEQNLDNILSGDDVPQTHNKPPAPATVPKEAVPTPPRSSTPSNNRLQERLAKAVAAKAAAQKNGAQTPLSDPPSRAGTPSILSASPRPSIDSINESRKGTPVPLAEPTGKGKENETLPTVQVEDTNKDDALAATETEEPIVVLTTNGLLKDRTEDKDGRQSTESTTVAPRQSTGSRQSLQVVDSSSRTSDESGARVQQILADADRDEEIHGYIERIDALQAKLQYLARESADSARKAAVEAGQATAEKKLAEKDEQIALLMEEGQKLSKTELKHMTVIKKLRVTTASIEKESKQVRDKLEKAEKEKAALTERLKRAEAAEKQATQNQKRLAQVEKDLEAVRTDSTSKDAIIANLKAQLSVAASQATGEEVKKLQSLLDASRSRINDLEEEVSSEKIERELSEDKARAQEKELRAKMEREAERARVAEVELKGEIQVLESRLEVMRARAEEASSGATGDAQAKLLRQIETLQTQYAVASENWQGIESSLTSRVTTLQKERDEALKRESDTRKKAREMTQKAKANEDETELLYGNISELGQELSELRTKLEQVQKTANGYETELRQAREQFEREKQSIVSELQQRQEEERNKYREGPPQSPYTNFDKAVSEVASSRRGLTAEFLGLQNIQTSRRPSRGVIDELPYTDRRISRTGSKANIMQSAGHVTPKRQDSALLLGTIDGGAGAPSISMDPEDYFENVQSPADHPNIHDIGSVSTQAAGPSVQLVERMSAAVRRLENEKVSMKEELARLASQRDEARSEIVALMQEVEAKREDHKKVESLEKEIESINQRYQTTLEMLGEKSETVEELKADVGDLKTMYRNLAEEYAKLKK